MMMVDAQVGMVTAALKENGLYENSLLVFTSDNGPVWYSEDVERLGHDSSGGLRGMKGDAWEGGHRVPFIVRWPGKVEAGSVSNQTIGFVDLMATLADVTGKPLPEGAGPDSHSFLPVLKGVQPDERPVRPNLVHQSAAGTMVIRSGQWKLIDRLGSGGFSKPRIVEPGPDDPPGQLYNLKADPGETTNLFHEHPEVVEMLKGELEPYLINN
jgi:arylsulfatase A-like enzyme